MGISIYLNTFNENCKKRKINNELEKYATNDDCHEGMNFIDGELIKGFIGILKTFNVDFLIGEL